MCPTCKTDRIFSINQRRQKLTMYFIPTVQYRSKQYMTCQGCGESFEIADKLKEEVAARLMTETELKSTIDNMAVESRSFLAICQNCKQPVGHQMRFCPDCGNSLL